MSSDKKQSCIDAINKIFNEYTDPIVFNKIEQYICSSMPIVINRYNEELIKKIDLTAEHEYFIEYFLTHNPFFYLKTTNKYFFYNKNDFGIIFEDDLLHRILRTISSSESKILRPWKQKTKNEIMKRIKNNNLFNCIPETDTIQSIVNTFIDIRLFNNKNDVKYFLTLIGDNILKKNTNFIHIISPNAKDFISELTNYCYINFGVNCNNSIKYKFYEHSFENTRLFNNNFIETDQNKWLDFLKKKHISILIIACYYSNKFGCSDNCLYENNMDENYIEHILYLKDKNVHTVLSDFINNYIQVTIDPNEKLELLVLSNSDITKINMKEMLYLWKHYLDCKQIPNLLFVNNFKTEILKHYSQYYNEELDSFIGLSSKHIPLIKLFIEYWDTNITFYDDYDYEFQISEIILLFKKWVIKNYNNTIINISEKKVIDIISYFLPDITICDNKFLLQIACSLWNKNDDILNSVNEFINHMKLKFSNITGKVPVYDLYNFYCERFKESKLIVKKKYFEKVLQDNFNWILDNDVAFLIIDI